MSVSVCWKPSVNNSKSVNGGSSLVTALEKAFKQLPITLDEYDIPILRGMAACGFVGCDELIEAIRENKKIEVTAEY